jgi:hypothetical protein
MLSFLGVKINVIKVFFEPIAPHVFRITAAGDRENILEDG